MRRTIALLSALALTGCPPTDAPFTGPVESAHVSTATLTPAQAAIMNMLEQPNYSTEQKVRLAQTLAEIERVRRW